MSPTSRARADRYRWIVLAALMRPLVADERRRRRERRARLASHAAPA